MWTLKLSKQAARFYEALSGKHKIQMQNALDNLEQDPYSGKTLKGDLKNFWSFRVRVYRVIYTIEVKEVIVEVLKIQHRKEVYEKFRG